MTMAPIATVRERGFNICRWCFVALDRHTLYMFIFQFSTAFMRFSCNMPFVSFVVKIWRLSIYSASHALGLRTVVNFKRIFFFLRFTLSLQISFSCIFPWVFSFGRKKNENERKTVVLSLCAEQKSQSVDEAAGIDIQAIDSALIYRLSEHYYIAKRCRFAIRYIVSRPMYIDRNANWITVCATFRLHR